MQHQPACTEPGQKPLVQDIKNEEKFRQLIKNSFDIVVLIDADGMQRYVSESCEKILGYSPEELTDVPVIETHIHPDDHEKAMTALRDLVAGKGSGGIHYRHRHKNGTWVYLEANGTNQLDNPAVKAIVLNVRDITHHIKVEQALRESEAHLKKLNAGKDKIFSIIAHDLKTPFMSILGFSELLVEQVRDKNYEGIENYAMGIRHSAQRTFDLLTNLLEWSYSQTGLMKYTPTTFDLVELIYGLRRLMESTARQKGIIIYCNLPEKLQVRADRNMISTIMRNLISNGIKFTHPGGGIKINAINSSEGITVSVADNGIGIAKQALGKLFDIQNTTSTPGTYKEMGTGLGLLLCREFIEKHGCSIGAESEQGKGSTFWFTVPAASAIQEGNTNKVYGVQ